MYKNKYLEAFGRAVNQLLGEDVSDTKKITLPVEVKSDLSLDEYEPGEEVLTEKWLEYKKIISDAVKNLPANQQLDASYEFTDIHDVEDFKIIYVDPHHVVVSYRINKLIYPAYEESDAVIEAEGAIIEDVMEQFGGSIMDPEVPEDMSSADNI